MALNPPIGPNFEPLRVQGEHFCLQRVGVEFELKIEGMGKLKGEGKVIVTTARLVLINPKGKPEFKSFDLPLALTHHESFEQPIFGANNWTGKCRPLNNSLPGEVTFKIWFMEGGCQKFIKTVRNNLKVLREVSRRPGSNYAEVLIQEYSSPSYAQQFALYDPSDPSTIYVSQPPVGGAPVIPQQQVQQPGYPGMQQPQYQQQNFGQPMPPQFQQQPIQYQQPQMMPPQQIPPQQFQPQQQYYQQPPPQQFMQPQQQAYPIQPGQQQAYPMQPGQQQYQMPPYQQQQYQMPPPIQQQYQMPPPMQQQQAFQNVAPQQQVQSQQYQIPPQAQSQPNQQQMPSSAQTQPQTQSSSTAFSGSGVPLGQLIQEREQQQ